MRSSERRWGNLAIIVQWDDVTQAQLPHFMLLKRSS